MKAYIIQEGNELPLSKFGDTQGRSVFYLNEGTIPLGTEIELYSIDRGRDGENGLRSETYTLTLTDQAQEALADVEKPSN